MPSVDVSSTQSHSNEIHCLNSAFRDVAVTKQYETPVQNSISPKAVLYTACSKKSLYRKGSCNAAVLADLILIKIGSKLLKLTPVCFFCVSCARHQYEPKFHCWRYAVVFCNSESWTNKRVTRSCDLKPRDFHVPQNTEYRFFIQELSLKQNSRSWMRPKIYAPPLLIL
jgi:hypothetical protein